MAEFIFICRHCKRESKGFPKHNEKTKQMKCPLCGEWQDFDGSLTYDGKPFKWEDGRRILHENRITDVCSACEGTGREYPGEEVCTFCKGEGCVPRGTNKL